MEASHAEDVHRNLELAHLHIFMQVHILDRLMEAEVILNNSEADENLAGRGRLWCEPQRVPLRSWDGVILGERALPLVDYGTSQVIRVIFAHERLVFIITVYDDWR